MGYTQRTCSLLSLVNLTSIPPQRGHPACSWDGLLFFDRQGCSESL